MSQTDLDKRAFLEALENGDLSELRAIFERAPSIIHDPYAFLGPWICLAARNESVAVVKWLLASGADLNHSKESTGATPLSAAATKGNLEIVTLLHEAGAALDTSTMAANPLIGAIQAYVPPKSREKCLDVALYLIDAGIDTTPSYITNRPIPEINALQFAVEMGARHIARAIGLHQTSGDAAATEALIAEADKMAGINTEPPDEG